MAEKDKNCESELKIDALTHQIAIDVFIVNNYFDPNEFKISPIKSYFQYYFVPLIKN